MTKQTIETEEKHFNKLGEDISRGLSFLTYFKASCVFRNKRGKLNIFFSKEQKQC